MSFFPKSDNSINSHFYESVVFLHKLETIEKEKIYIYKDVCIVFIYV